MKTLITGGAGFIGSELISQLSGLDLMNLIVIDTDIQRLKNLESRYGVQCLVMDAGDVKLLDELVTARNITRIVHLAANSDIRSGISSSKPDFENTLRTSLAISEVIKNSRIERVFFASSSAVYGVQTLPIRINDSLLKAPTSFYGWAKLGSELALECACLHRNARLTVIRFPNVVGPEPTHGLLFDLKNKLVSNPLHLEVLGDGSQRKPYMHVEDLVKVIIKLFWTDSVQSEFVNVGPSDTVTVRKIVDIALQISGLSPTIEWGASPEGWIGDVPYYEFGDELPSVCKEIEIRKSEAAITDSFRVWWNKK